MKDVAVITRSVTVDVPEKPFCESASWDRFRLHSGSQRFRSPEERLLQRHPLVAPDLQQEKR